MASRHWLLRYASVVVYFAIAYAVLYWYAGRGYFCARTGSFPSTFRFAFMCTIWDLIACGLGSSIARYIMKLRTAAPLLTGAFAAVGLASIPFWISSGYGHFLFEGTWLDVSCFFTEGYGLVFPFLMAPALGVLSLVHGAVLLNISKKVVPTVFC